MENVSGRISIEQAAGRLLQHKEKTVQNGNDIQMSFEQILQQRKDAAAVTQSEAIGGLRFSKHADMRLVERSINLTKEQMQRLEEGTKLAGAKGIKESLVIMDNLSFIVNTGNNTVITAMEQAFDGENVYTNIDGAVII